MAPSSQANQEVGLAPYVPSLAATWDGVAEGRQWRAVDGSLVFVDISGFTNLSERLAHRGRIGAEELTSILDRVFGEMLDVVAVRGGSLLKFGGDALLLLFEGDDHVLQACAAAVEMRAALREAATMPTSVGRIPLKMSIGIHSGAIDLFVVGDSHRELLITGPAATTTAEMETTAGANEIVVSDAVRGRLPPGFIGEGRGSGWLLKKRRIDLGGVEAAAVPGGETALADFVPRGLRATLGSGIDDSEHRIGTVGFIEFSDVAAPLSARGPDGVAEALHHLVGTVQRHADREQVTFLATDIDADGGKIILVTGVPSSLHDDEGRMLRTVRRVLDDESPFTLRAGVNRGHVFAGDVGSDSRRTYTVMGDTVNLAARLMAAAGPGQLYVSPGALEHSATLFRTESLPEFFVKGKQEAIRAYEVFEETGVRPPDLHHELPFRGRDSEMEMIVGIVNTCARVGRGGMMTFTGPIGVGKSRLMAEVLERCPGLPTLMIQAEPNGVDNPYWAFRDPLRRLLGIERSDQATMAAALRRSVGHIAPDLVEWLPLLGDVVHVEMEETDESEALDPRFRPDRTSDVVVQVLSLLHSEPFAVVAEDGQWLDDASRALLERIGEAARDRPWTVMVTAREDGSEIAPLGDRIEIRPLTDAAIREIATEATMATPLRPHELSAVVDRSDGSPLYLSEILKMLSQTGTLSELPESLDAVVSTEIDILAPTSRQLLRYSSVLGRSFRKVVLDEFLAIDGLNLDLEHESELGQFLEPDEDSRVRFSHAVVHEIAYQGLSYRRRRDLHARAGEVIERLAGKDPEGVAEFLSYHYSQSGAHQKTWQYAQVAAEKARRAYANTEAAVHYQRALEAARHVDTSPQGDVADLWIELGEVRELAGQMEASRDAYSHAFGLDAGDVVRRADISLRRAGTWMSSGNLTQAKRFVALGQRDLHPGASLEQEKMLARLVAFESSIYMLRNEPSRAAGAAERAAEMARTSGEEEALARAYAVLDWAHFMLGEDAPRHGPEAIEIYQRLGLLERSVGVMNNMGAFAYLEGRWNEAVDWYEQSLDSAERSGNILEAALTRANIAEVLVGQGKPEQARALLAEARRTYESSHSDYYLPLVGLLEGRAMIAAGAFDAAADLLEALLEGEQRSGPSPWADEIELAYAEALVRAGGPQAGIERLSASATGGRASPGVFRVRGLGLAALGLDEAAFDALRLGLEAAVDQQNLFEEALILEAMVETGGRAGDDPDPVAFERLAELRDQLGLVALQPQSS